MAPLKQDVAPLADATVIDLTTSHGRDEQLVYPFGGRSSAYDELDADHVGPVVTRPRRWPKRLLILVVVVGLLAGGAYVAQMVYLRILFNRIETIPVEPGVLDESASVPESAVGATTPSSVGNAKGGQAKGGPAATPGAGTNATVSSATIVKGEANAKATSAVKAKATATAKAGAKGKVTATAKAKTPSGVGAAPVAFGPLIDTSGIAAVAADDDEVQNILLIGVDSRANVAKAECQTFGCDKVGTGSRSDTIMLARVSPKNRSADLLSIPRDLWVRQARSGKWAKVNSAYAAGATSLIATLQQNLNVPINHLVEIDFSGFEKLVRAVGGVELCFDLPTRDKVTGLSQGPGCHIVDDRQAIAYVRSRHYEQQRADKVWRADPTGDLGRIKRQQLFIRSTMVRVLAQAKGNPLKFDQLLSALPGAVRIDNSFSFNDVKNLADQFRSFDPNNLHTFTVPAASVRIGKQDVLKIDIAKAPAVIGKFGRRV